MTSPKHKTSHRYHHAAVLSDFEQALNTKVRDLHTVSVIIKDIQEWTGGQPFLTQLLCTHVIKYADQMNEGLAAGIVARVVHQKIVHNWETNVAASHLKKIRQVLLNYKFRNPLFTLYVRVLQKGSVTAKQSQEQVILLKSGLLRLENGQLVTNAIYSKIFNLKWVEQQLPGITQRTSTVAAHSGHQSLSWLKQLPQAAIAVMAIGGIAIGGVTLLASSRADSPSVLTRRTQLTLLGDTFSGYSTFRNPEFKSALRKVEIDLTYDNEFDQSLRAQKLNDGTADLMVTTLDQVLQHKPNGKIIGLLDRTVGADAVVLNTKAYPNLKSLINLSELVKQERDKGNLLSITYAAGTPSEYLALVLDAKFDDFNLSDFKLKPVVDASEAWALMQDPNENVAIAVLWEPFVTQARQQGYNVVLSSNDAPTAIVDVIVASDRLIQSNPEMLSHLLENYYRRIDANTSDATQLQTQVARDGNLSVSDASAIINGIDFFNAIESKDWMRGGLLSKRIGATAAVLTLSNRLDGVQSNPKALYTDRFLAEAVKNSETLISLIRADNPLLANKLAGTSNDTVQPLVTISVTEMQQAPDIGNLEIRGEVSFSVGSAELTEEGKQTLDQLSSELNEFNDQTIAARVIGHTSRTGSAEVNQLLSQERTRVVVDYLRSMKVTLNIVPEGKGFTDPLPNLDPADVRNQRTEIRLVRIN